MGRDRSGVLWVGLGLIGLGVVLLVATILGWDTIWPAFPLLGGLVFWGGYVDSGFKDEGFAFTGTLAFLIGLFFFGFTLRFWEWGDMERLWPVFVLIAGAAFFVMFLAQRAERDLGVLGVSLVALVAGAVGLAVTHKAVGADIVKYWPALLVLVGLLSLMRPLSRLFRRP